MNDKVKEEILKEISEYSRERDFSIAAVFLYGSRLHGTSTHLSDYDVKLIYYRDTFSFINNSDKGYSIKKSINNHQEMDIKFVSLKSFIQSGMNGRDTFYELIFNNLILYKDESIFPVLMEYRDEFLNLELS